MNTPVASYRPRAFYERETARKGDENEAREALRRLTSEYEQLRAWVREQGMIPPRFDVPDTLIRDIAREPVTEFQRILVLVGVDR